MATKIAQQKPILLKYNRILINWNSVVIFDICELNTWKVITLEEDIKNNRNYYENGGSWKTKKRKRLEKKETKIVLSTEQNFLHRDASDFKIGQLDHEISY